MITQKNDTGTWRDKKEKSTLEKIRIQLEEINQKVLAKKGRLERYRKSKTDKTGHSKISKENSTNKWEGMT